MKAYRMNYKMLAILQKCDCSSGVATPDLYKLSKVTQNCMFCSKSVFCFISELRGASDPIAPASYTVPSRTELPIRLVSGGVEDNCAITGAKAT